MTLGFYFNKDPWCSKYSFCIYLLLFLLVYIYTFLVNRNLDITKYIAQSYDGASYDGASVMSGCNNGVQVKISILLKNACPYVHSHAHRLNLVLVDTV